MYTLMRSYHNKEQKTLVIDLYDYENKKNVELHYCLYWKRLESGLIDILRDLTFKTLDLTAWDNIIKQFIVEK